MLFRKEGKYLMSDKDTKKEPQTPNAQGAAPQYGMMVHTQYVKDFSFENPNAPESYSYKGASTPNMDANINMHAKALDGEQNLYEIVLEVSAQATREGKTMFLAEISYGIVASVNENVPEQHRHPLLLIEGPKLAFPFVRQMLANAIQDGGYPPLLLQPVNFEELYKQQYLEQARAQAAAEANGKTKN